MNKLHVLLLICISSIYLPGCLTTCRTKSEPIGTGMFRVTETKKEGREKQTTKQEIVVVPEEHGRYHDRRHNDDRHVPYYGHYNDCTPEPVITVIPEEPYMSPVITENPYFYFDDIKPVFSVSYRSSALWTLLSTKLSVNGQSNSPYRHSGGYELVYWDHPVEIGGSGYEFELYKAPFWGINFSSFKNVTTTRLNLGNSLYAIETVQSSLWTLSFVTKPCFNENAYGILGLDIVDYGVKTSISTNLPQYTYEGIEGNRASLMLDIGIGIQLNKDASISPKIELGISIPVLEEVIESGLGHISAGIQFRF